VNGGFIQPVRTLAQAAGPAASNIDLSGIGNTISEAFIAVGNMLLLVSAGVVFAMLVITGMSLLAVPLNRSASNFVKTNIGWIIGGVAFLSGTGLLGKALGAAIQLGKF